MKIDKPKDDEDILVVKACLRGEIESFTRLIEKYQNMIYNLCYRLTGGSKDAEDLAQETFVNAYRHLKNFDIEKKFFTWIYTIALNLCRDRMRRKKIDKYSIDAPLRTNEDLYLQISSGEMSPEDIALCREEEARIQKCITALPYKYRQVVLLRHQQGLSYEEIAQVTGKSLYTIKVWLHRARKKLNGLFKEAGLE